MLEILIKSINLSQHVLIKIIKIFFVIVSEVIMQVQSVINTIARLPCDLSTPIENDFVTLIIWYRKDSDSPLYSVDARDRPLDQASHWSGKSYGGRIFFQPSDKTRDGISKLSLKNVNESDAGNYKCRVDFKKSPTRNSYVNLTVIGKSIYYYYYFK